MADEPIAKESFFLNYQLIIIISGVFAGLIVFFSGIALGGASYQSTWENITADKVRKEATESYNLAQQDFYSSLIELHTIQSKIFDKKIVKVFIIRDSMGESLYIANETLDLDSKKEILHLDFASSIHLAQQSMRFFSFQLVERIVVGYGGSEIQDLLIFTPDGDVISESVIDNNQELKNWMVYYDSIETEYIIRLRLYKMSGERATALLDIRSGELLPDSFGITND